MTWHFGKRSKSFQKAIHNDDLSVPSRYLGVWKRTLLEQQGRTRHQFISVMDANRTRAC
jgi:hypothetical protein